MMVEDGGIYQKYEEELEMNDFPQQVEGDPDTGGSSNIDSGKVSGILET